MPLARFQFCCSTAHADIHSCWDVSCVSVQNFLIKRQRCHTFTTVRPRRHLGIDHQSYRASERRKFLLLLLMIQDLQEERNLLVGFADLESCWVLAWCCLCCFRRL